MVAPYILLVAAVVSALLALLWVPFADVFGSLAIIFFLLFVGSTLRVFQHFGM